MAHHKRGKPKDARSGCIFCKRHKSNCNKGSEEHQTFQERKARVSEKEQRDELRGRVNVLSDV